MILVRSFALAVALSQPAVSPPPPPPIATAPATPPHPPVRIKAAPPVPPLLEPSPAARELASMLIELVWPEIEAAGEADLTRDLTRWSPQQTPCDPQNADCARIASEVAKRESPRLLRAMRDIAAVRLAAHFDGAMTPAQAEAAARFFRDPGGAAFFHSLSRLPDFAGRARPHMIAAEAELRAPVYAEFLRLTADLPRRPRPVPPQPLRTVPSPTRSDR